MRRNSAARLRLASHVFLLGWGLVSCRGILGITPGKEAVGGSGGSSGDNGGTTSTGLTDAGGDQALGGTGGKGTAGKGGGNSLGGSTGHGGSVNAGGEAGAATMLGLFPEGACSACMERNCAAESTACQAVDACASAVPDWLTCNETDAQACVAAKPAELHAIEACGAESCDLCRHATDGTPTVEILTPSNGATIPVDATNLIEVSVRVQNFTVKALGQCAAGETNCGHIHLNLDGANCHVTPFYNQIVTAVSADGSADTTVATTTCVMPVFGKSVAISASLSSNSTHMDRVPAVQATVHVTLEHQ